MSVGSLFARVGGADERRAARRSRREAAGKRTRARDLPTKAERQTALRAMRKRRRARIGKGIKSAVQAVGKAAKAVATNPVFRAVVSAASVALPVLAPAAAGLEVASRVVKKIDKGAKVAKSLRAAGRKATKAEQAVLKKAVAAKRTQIKIVELAYRGDARSQRGYGAMVGATVARRALKRQALRAKKA